ncbi:MAG: aldo/keto reductase, partial [Enterococcus sp.]|nr:aldo/keto reductase [Enterococcus sp.]
MYYKDLAGERVSALGLGMMRLPLKTGKDSSAALRDGDNAPIDKAQVEEMVAYAIEHGINYFDTAWGYHDENSELVAGEVLKNYERDSFFLATKFPGYDLGNMPKVKEIFTRQLEKCQVEYFDFYLIHNVCESNIDGYL